MYITIFGHKQDKKAAIAKKMDIFLFGENICIEALSKFLTL